MFGLPSTTDVSQRLPKEAFYRNMKVSKREKDLLVSDVERITVVGVINPRTANVADGEKVHEILVVEIEPRGGSVPDDVMFLVKRANNSKMVFHDTGMHVLCAITDGRLYRNMTVSLALHGHTLDEVWKSFVAQIVFSDIDGTSIEYRLHAKERINTLAKERDRLDSSMHRERQIGRKNELYDRYRIICEEISKLENQLKRRESKDEATNGQD